MTNTALFYALGEFFCMAIMLILTGALKPITNYGKREKWLAASLVSETLYFLGDALDKLQMGGVLPASQAGLLFTGTYNANFPEQSNSSPLRKCPKPAKILYF
ncbi:hypothetical protein [Lactobacillus delbrueckii]|uniref:hypothetical protein n=1 Tax=Lactobacillus delbrueckii TaxID=1584 RepID=UPI001E44BAA9|nr:hypothetical protein [Lactobacillus delbrueckii]MCD5441242.1 hypothetical protein [Lactobacillus delbrueckii subsp. lactis]MCD5485328.1 hypothetical protein [Lactobacillus delbrueckii subsp. lactis]